MLEGFSLVVVHESIINYPLIHLIKTKIKDNIIEFDEMELWNEVSMRTNCENRQEDLKIVHCKYLNARFECNDIVIFIYSHYHFV